MLEPIHVVVHICRRTTSFVSRTPLHMGSTQVSLPKETLLLRQQTINLQRPQSSKLYLNHSPTALKLSHLTLSSLSVINSITLPFNPNFSNTPLFSGTSFTNHPTSLHAIASTCFSSSHCLSIIARRAFGSALPSSSRILRAFSTQKVASRWGGDQRRWPDWISAAYSSKVVCELVYSSSISVRDLRSSRRSGSERWRPLRFERRAGRRACVAAGNSVDLFEGAERMFRSVERSNRVVFSLGERRSSCA